MKSAAGARDYRASRRRRAGLTFTFLAVALCVVMVLSAGLGQYNIPTDQVVASVGRRLGLAPENPAMQLADSTLWNIRFPRVLLGVLVGAALGTSGAVMQSVFGNPLAEPGVIGVSSGAAVGACLSIVLNLQFFGIFTTPAFAFVGALAATALVYFLSRSSGRAKVLSMILTGIAVTAVANAIIAFLMFIADTTSRDQIVFWQMGSLNGSTWKAVASAAFGCERGAPTRGVYCGDGSVDRCCGGVCGHYCIYWPDYSAPVAHDFGSVESCVVAGFGIGWRTVDCAV